MHKLNPQQLAALSMASAGPKASRIQPKSQSVPTGGRRAACPPACHATKQGRQPTQRDSAEKRRPAYPRVTLLARQAAHRLGYKQGCQYWNSGKTG